MRPTDDKTRENIIRAKLRGESGELIAYWLNVSIGTINNVWKEYRESEEYKRTPYISLKSNSDINTDVNKQTDYKIRKIIEKNPRITLKELRDELSLSMTISGLSRKLSRMGIPQKDRQ